MTKANGLTRTRVDLLLALIQRNPGATEAAVRSELRAQLGDSAVLDSAILCGAVQRRGAGLHLAELLVEVCGLCGVAHEALLCPGSEPPVPLVDDRPRWSYRLPDGSVFMYPVDVDQDPPRVLPTMVDGAVVQATLVEVRLPPQIEAAVLWLWTSPNRPIYATPSALAVRIRPFYSTPYYSLRFIEEDQS